MKGPRSGSEGHVHCTAASTPPPSQTQESTAREYAVPVRTGAEGGGWSLMQAAAPKALQKATPLPTRPSLNQHPLAMPISLVWGFWHAYTLHSLPLQLHERGPVGGESLAGLVVPHRLLQALQVPHSHLGLGSAHQCLDVALIVGQHRGAVPNGGSVVAHPDKQGEEASRGGEWGRGSE